VTCLALQNAASVAGLLLTTETMIAEAPSESACCPLIISGACFQGDYNHVSNLPGVGIGPQ
jgi:hypothetical protein